MSTETPAIQWTRQEFLAYLLLYAAHIDTNFGKEERQYILSKVEPKTFEKVLAEFSADNDYHHVQKIMAYQKNDDTLSEEKLLKEIKELFLSDERFHPMEQQMLAMLKMLFK